MTSNLPIYLDYHATTPVDPRVVEVVLHAMTTTFGNPNSVEHIYGEIAADLVVESRHDVAELVDAEQDGVYFTSGASESIRLAFAHAVAGRSIGPLRVAVTTVEHRSVLDALSSHERKGEVSVSWIPVDNQARLNLEALKVACHDGVDLICVMGANNEVGTIYPIEEVASIAARAGAGTLIDATAAVGQIPIHTDAWGITYLILSGHKIYGPKGIGALVCPPSLNIWSSHSNTPGTGDGTPNVPGILGLGAACRLRRLEMASDEPQMVVKRNRLETLLINGIDGLVINGDHDHRLSNNLHVSIPDVPNDAVIAKLRHTVALSTGAACTSGAQTSSHVLRAMGLSYSLQEGALRISTGKFTTDEEIELAGKYIVEAVTAVRGEIGCRKTCTCL
jgi:cysteine desulfurase